jgi:4-alpha-glucanotransferase
MRADGYGWWIDRLRRELLRFDAIRLDHFVAFHRYWEVGMGQETAKNGRYVEVPGRDFLERARQALGGLPLLAEDLGIVTQEVNDLRDGVGLPGMRILQFAFTPGAEAYLPHRHPERCVIYTGTHDNNTTRGWYELLLSHAAQTSTTDERRQRMASDARVELERIRLYTGITRAGEVSPGMLRALFSSPALTAIFPIQDALDEGSDARMNVPGTPEGNWAYRVAPDALKGEVAGRLADLAVVTERAPS